MVNTITTEPVQTRIREMNSAARPRASMGLVNIYILRILAGWLGYHPQSLSYLFDAITVCFLISGPHISKKYMKPSTNYCCRKGAMIKDESKVTTREVVVTWRA